MSAATGVRCGRCGEPLRLAGTLWRTVDASDPWCAASVADVVAEQYDAAGVVPESNARRRIMHAPEFGWVHPALR